MNRQAPHRQGNPGSLSVVLSTHNRASTLDLTLSDFERLSRPTLDTHFVIVDNNSTDSTPDVIKAHQSSLPIQHFWAPMPGKNAALNVALEQATLGDIIVFTDDDILPDTDWLLRIAESVQDWPDHSVFGGCVELRWPAGPIPAWAEELAREPWAFAAHNLGPIARTYPPDRTPSGPNFWIVHRIVELGYRFDESIGPHPTNRLMGSETTFLRRLRTDGHVPVFIPEAIVHHHVEPRLLTPQGIRRRAVSNGRGGARQRLLGPPAAPNGGISSRLRSIAGKTKWRFEYLSSWLVMDPNERVLRQIRAMRGIGWHREMTKASTSSEPEVGR